MEEKSQIISKLSINMKIRLFEKILILRQHITIKTTAQHSNHNYKSITLNPLSLVALQY